MFRIAATFVGLIVLASCTSAPQVPPAVLSELAPTGKMRVGINFQNVLFGPGNNATLDVTKFRKRTAYMKVINRYIFPGGELDYIGMTTTDLERHGFEVRDVESMREHYYLSLKAWSENLYANREAAIAAPGNPLQLRL